MPPHSPETVARVVAQAGLSETRTAAARGDVESCVLSGCCGHDGLEFNGGQSAKSNLTAPEGGAFDPVDDHDTQLLTGGTRTAVRDALLQQREERFHPSIVAALTG